MGGADEKAILVGAEQGRTGCGRCLHAWVNDITKRVESELGRQASTI